MPRSQERWIGGVAGGIAARLGIDPLIVRGVFLVITIFGGFGLLVYGLAWALLPEASDGRIHLQEAIRGRFDAALVGAAVFTVIGLSRVGFWWDGWVGIPFMIGMIALVALAVVVITAIRNSGRSTPPGNSPGAGPSAPAGGSTPPGEGGTPPPTAQPTSGGSVPFTTAYPEQSGAVGFPTGSGVEYPQVTSGEPGGQDPAGPWSDDYAAGPWTEEPAEGDTGSEQADTTPTDAAEHPAPHPPDSEDSAGSADETVTATYPASTAPLAADATPTVAYPAAETSAPAEDAAEQTSTWPGQPEASSQAPWSAGAGTPPTTPPAQPPATAPPPPPPQQPPKPPRPRRPGPGKLLARATLGLALLVIAALVLGAEYYAWPDGGWQTSPWLVALGAGLVVIGLGATLAGILGRRSASLGVIGTILAIVLVPWAISAPVLTQYNLTDSTSYGDRYWAPATMDQAADGYNLAAGSIRVDLSDLAEQAEGQDPTPIDIELGAGDVELMVPDGMPVTVTASVQGETRTVNLSDWSAEVDGEPRDLGHRTELGWRFGTSPMIAELTAPEAESTPAIPVNIEVGFGAIEVRELP